MLLADVNCLLACSVDIPNLRSFFGGDECTLWPGVASDGMSGVRGEVFLGGGAGLLSVGLFSPFIARPAPRRNNNAMAGCRRMGVP